ncbi:hypothetical protein QTP70_009965 [Hemibagrus guttatus]|uniref:Shisa N-terminal domain-containing protein n=1 Tax=Hemibagrus guttatus TaxID=175788 RepID=A0AAE0UY14_9TELE|nr:hypothetical protein QTP70_009965 [Hemibagrus guttatus]
MEEIQQASQRAPTAYLSSYQALFTYLAVLSGQVMDLGMSCYCIFKKSNIKWHNTTVTVQRVDELQQQKTTSDFTTGSQEQESDSIMGTDSTELDSRQLEKDQEDRCVAYGALCTAMKYIGSEQKLQMEQAWLERVLTSRAHSFKLRHSVSLLHQRTKRTKVAPRRNAKPKELNGTVHSQVPAPAPVPAAGQNHDTCLGYYDVSGQFDREFECNNTDHRYCCGSCYLRFCCQFRGNRLDQRACKNYNKPDWVKTAAPSPAPTSEPYDPSADQTNTAVYITCGVIAFVIALGVSAKVAYDKATRPPQEMNIHRALADILRQQGPIPISQYDCENFAAMNSSSKDDTPQRTGSKNHYTPVHTSKSNHGGHYTKESVRGGGHDLHNFISSGFVTLGRGHGKGNDAFLYRMDIL